MELRSFSTGWRKGPSCHGEADLDNSELMLQPILPDPKKYMDTRGGMSGEEGIRLAQGTPTLVNIWNEALPLRQAAEYLTHLKPCTWAALTQADVCGLCLSHFKIIS